MSAKPAKLFRRILLFWTFFIGLGAVAGSVGMLADPTGKAMGMDVMLPYFQVLPLAEVLFQDYLFSGIMLLIVNGLTNLLAAGLLLFKKPLGILLGGAFGVTLMLWICIQFYMFPANFLSTAYFLFGLAQAVTGFCAWVFTRQEAFRLPKETPVTDPRHLVVYFSRMGYVKKAALEAAQGGVLYEIRTTQPTGGIGGFWWCGYCGLCRRDMPIVPPPLNFADFDRVTICAPIWVFSLAAPLRSFCKMAHGQIRQADYVLVHHTPGLYRNVADEMDRLLGIRHTGFTSICCKAGRFVKTRKSP